MEISEEVDPGSLGGLAGYLKLGQKRTMDQKIDKKRILKAIEELPEDATIEQAIYKLYVLDQVNKALADNGEKNSHEDMEKELLDN